MRADLFEFANVGFLFLFGRKQRPDLRDLVALYIEHARAFWRVKPFVQAGPEVVTVQVLLLELKVSERMRPVDNRFYSARPGHLTDSFYRSNLTGDVDHVRHLNQTRARCDCPFKGSRNLVDVLWRDRNFDQVQLDSFALFALANRGQHASVILSRGQYLIARFQIETEQQS